MDVFQPPMLVCRRVSQNFTSLMTAQIWRSIWNSCLLLPWKLTCSLKKNHCWKTILFFIEMAPFSKGTFLRNSGRVRAKHFKRFPIGFIPLSGWGKILPIWLAAAYPNYRPPHLWLTILYGLPMGTLHFFYGWGEFSLDLVYTCVYITCIYLYCICNSCIYVHCT